VCATASNVIVWNPVLRAKLPYDPLKDYAPILHAGFFDSALLVHPSLPASTVRELFDYVKANPGKVNWGHFGVNSTGYMYQEWLKRNRQVPFYPVPYKTNPQAQQALIVGETHVGVNSLPSMAAHIKSGKVRPLAVTTGKRLDWLPGVPTFEELGIKLPLRTWFGYHYQSAAPRELVLRMNAELRRTMEHPDYRSKVLERLWVAPHLGTPEEFDAFIRQQLKDVAELVAYLGIRPE
jgi:tripartite-type tricarboxylate transporter receptor subunit TctC